MNKRIQYRRCHADDIPSLKRLWSLCFPDDTTNDIDAFFSQIFPLSVTLAGFINDEPVTMLHLLPARARRGGDSQPVWYLYAGGTHPLFRSQGYYRELMQVARRFSDETPNIAIYLRPAEESLFSYYAALGYTNAISTVYGDKSSTWIWEPIEPIASFFGHSVKRGDALWMLTTKNTDLTAELNNAAHYSHIFGD